MTRKIFVSYKYGDADVRSLPPVGNGLIPVLATTARNYVDVLADHLDANDHIYKGENDNESLAGFKDETIESKLRDKIFDTSITIVLISKNMQDTSMSEDDQWIPWEIAYSLKEMTKGDRTSKTNGMIAVVLPDRNGSYDYFVKPICQNCASWQNDSAFKIIGKNMFNRKQPKTIVCSNHPNSGAVHTGYDHSYIYPVKWDEFIQYVNTYINLAAEISENVDDYEITKIH
jgi:hypothetical protein